MKASAVFILKCQLRLHLSEMTTNNLSPVLVKYNSNFVIPVYQVVLPSGQSLWICTTLL